MHDSTFVKDGQLNTVITDGKDGDTPMKRPSVNWGVSVLMREWRGLYLPKQPTQFY
jgi:hypothetical protein